MWQGKVFRESGFFIRWSLLILFFFNITGPARSWAVGPNTHLVKWSAGGTNSPAGLTNVIKIASGLFYDVVVRADGTVAQLGGPGTPPAGLSNVVAVAAGWDHSLAATADGSVVA